MPLTIDQLLATLAVDAASATVVAGRIAVIQRDPQPDETGIAIDTDVRFLIVDLDADPLAPGVLPTFDINIEGALAGSYSGGVFTPAAPWTGSVTPTTAADPFVGWYVVLQQPAPPVFSSEQIVNVEIEVYLGSGWGYGPWGHFPWGHPPAAASIKVEYEFTIEDLTPPCIVSAEAVDQFTARVTFDDEMATTGPGSVLDVDNWINTIVRLNDDPEPGVSLEVVEVAEVAGSGGTQFDLTFQWEMTPGCLYRIDVNPLVEDSSGNSMDVTCSSTLFYGFQHDVPACRFFDHWRQMVPLKNRIEDEARDLERFSLCAQEAVELLLYQIDRFTDQFDQDLASDAVIDAMLYDVGNPFEWADLELDADQRRKLLRYLINIYKLKGTSPGIEDTIFFLLGEDVTVVEYAAEGWVLGEDELGEGNIAEVLCDAGEPYDFSVSRGLLLEVDSEPPQTITFDPADFVDPFNGLASEVAAVVIAQIVGGGAYVVAAGTPAIYISPAGPFALFGGEQLDLTIQGEAHSVVFHVGDFGVPGAATPEEVATRLEAELEGVVVYVDGATFGIKTIHTGADAEIVFVSGSALAGLGIAPSTTATGTDAKRVAVYSSTAGVDSWVRVDGGTANDVLDFDTDTYGGTGGAILAPDDSYTLYCFDIETQTELDSETKAIIRRIADYMKPAHTHLINIRTAPPLPWPDGWVLGVSELDVSTMLTS